MISVGAVICIVVVLATFLANYYLPVIPSEFIPVLFLVISNCLWISMAVLGIGSRLTGHLQGLKRSSNLVFHVREECREPVINAYVQDGENEDKFREENVTEDCLLAVKDFLKMRMNGRSGDVGVCWRDQHVGKVYQLVLMERDDDGSLDG